MHFHKNSLKYNMLSCIINPDRQLYRTNFCLHLDSPCIRRTGANPLISRELSG
jgi:hypothetical protein